MFKNNIKKLVTTITIGTMMFSVASPAMAATMGEPIRAADATILEEQSRYEHNSSPIYPETPNWNDGTWQLEPLNYKVEEVTGEKEITKNKNLSHHIDTTNAKIVNVGRKDLPLNIGNAIIHDIVIYANLGYTVEYAIQYTPLVKTAVLGDRTIANVYFGGTSNLGVAAVSGGFSLKSHISKVGNTSDNALYCGADLGYNDPEYLQKIWAPVSIWNYSMGNDYKDHPKVKGTAPIFFVAEKFKSASNYEALSPELWTEVKGIRFHDEDKSYRDMTKLNTNVITPEDKVEVESPSLSMTLDGKTITADSGALPLIENGNTIVPLRTIAEALGLEVKFDEGTISMASANGDTVTCELNSSDLVVNGEVKQMTKEAIAINGTTYVPVRAISEAFGCEVNFIKESNTIAITT